MRKEKYHNITLVLIWIYRWSGTTPCVWNGDDRRMTHETGLTLRQQTGSVLWLGAYDDIGMRMYYMDKELHQIYDHSCPRYNLVNKPVVTRLDVPCQGLFSFIPITRYQTNFRFLISPQDVGEGQVWMEQRGNARFWGGHFLFELLVGGKRKRKDVVRSSIYAALCGQSLF